MKLLLRYCPLSNKDQSSEKDLLCSFQRDTAWIWPCRAATVCMLRALNTKFQMRYLQVITNISASILPYQYLDYSAETERE